MKKGIGLVWRNSHGGNIFIRIDATAKSDIVKSCRGRSKIVEVERALKTSRVDSKT